MGGLRLWIWNCCITNSWDPEYQAKSFVSQNRRAQKNLAEPPLFDAKAPGYSGLQPGQKIRKFNCNEAEENLDQYGACKQWRGRFLPSSTNAVKALLMKKKEIVLEEVKTQAMEERVISGHSEDSPGK